jgi:membrane protease YdiL (CAAX protease family)
VILLLTGSVLVLSGASLGYFLGKREKAWGIGEFFLLFFLWMIGIGLGMEACPQRWKEIAIPLGMFLGGIGLLSFLLFRCTSSQLGFKRFSRDMMLWILGTVVVQIIISTLWVVLCTTIGGPIENQVVVSEFLSASPYERWAFIFVIVFWAPLIEELLMRGFCWNAISGTAYQKIAFTGIFFGFLHLDNLYSVPPLCAFGILLGFLRYRSDSIWPPILAHLLNNSIVLINVAWL